MSARSWIVAWSVVPLASIGAAFALLGVRGLGSPESALIWLVPGLVALGAAVGVARDRRWGYVLEGLVGGLTEAFFAFFAYFSIGMTLSESGDFGEPMLGTPLGTLDGYASIALFGASLVGGAWLLAAAVLGSTRHRGGRAPAPSVVALLVTGCALLGASGFGLLVAGPFTPVFALVGLAMVAAALVLVRRRSAGYVLEGLVGLGLAASALVYVRYIVGLIEAQVGSLDAASMFVVALYTAFLVTGVGLVVAAVIGLGRHAPAELGLER